MSLVTDRKDGYTALTIDANPIYPAAAWAHKFELNTDNTTGLTFDIYARKTPSSTERCFNIAFTEVEEGGLKVLYPLAVNEATANSFNRKNVVVTCQFTEDATGNVYILYEDYVDVGIGSIENVIEVPEVGGTITVSDGDYGDVVVSGNGLVWTVTSGSSIADAQVETAYNNQVAAASQAESEAGTEAGIRRFSPLRIAQAIAALASSAVDWALAQTSAVANGASNVAFKFVADNDFNLGKLFSFSDNSGDEKFYYKNGLIYITESGYSTIYYGALNAHQTGFHISYGGKNFVWTGSNTTTDDDFVNFSFHGLKFVTGTDATLGYNKPEADQATSNMAVLAQSANLSATTNQDGGDLTLGGGDKATGGGTIGTVLVNSSNTTPSDSKLSASQLTFFIDEGSDKLIVKAKYANGTTVKTFEVNANP